MRIIKIILVESILGRLLSFMGSETTMQFHSQRMYKPSSDKSIGCLSFSLQIMTELKTATKHGLYNAADLPCNFLSLKFTPVINNQVSTITNIFSLQPQTFSDDLHWNSSSGNTR